MIEARAKMEKLVSEIEATKAGDVSAKRIAFEAISILRVLIPEIEDLEKRIEAIEGGK